MNRLTLLCASTAIFALAAALPASAHEAAKAPTADITPDAVVPEDQDDASAQDQDLGDIIITARRRSESLQNVPMSVTALSTEKIDRNGVQNIADVAKLAPSLMFDKFFGPQDNRPAMRGLPATRGRPPVGILIDGIDVSTESVATAGGGNLMNLRLVDFERIEVVKGPQSALYGRAAFGGAINYITKEPGDSFGGYAAAEVGLYGRYEMRGALDLPLAEDFSIRVNGVYSKFKGYYRNTTTGNKLGGYETFGGALAAKWEPSDAVKIIARASYADNHENPAATKYYGLNNGLAVSFPLPAAAGGQIIGGSRLPVALTSYRPGYIENENVPVALSPDPIDPTGKSDYPGAHTYNFIGSLRASFDFGFATLSTWTGYTDSRGSTVADVDFFGRPYTQVSLPSPGGLGEYSGAALANGFWQFDINTKIKQFSQEVRFGNLSGGPFRWAVGGLIWNENVDQIDRRFTNYGLGAGASVSLNVTLLGGRATRSANQGRETRHLSGYAILEYDITSKLAISAEGRYAREKLSYLFGPSVTLQSGANLANGPAQFITTGTVANASSTTTYFTPRGIISWKPVDEVMFYASAARGIKPGGFTQVGNTDPNLGKYAPERLSSYEIGAKTTLFDRRLRLNASVFHIDYTDKLAVSLISVPFSVNPLGQISVTNNSGTAMVDGQEIDFSALITRELVLSGSYTHLAPRYTDYVINSSNALNIARAGNCTVVTVNGTTTCEISMTGRTLESGPRHSGQLSLTWTKTLAGDAKLFIDGTGQYRGKRYLEETNNWVYRPFALFDVKIGFETKAWSITAYVDNLFNDKTIKSAINVNDVPSGLTGQQIIVAYAPDPRTAGLRFKYNF